jgi:hypothetical protein
MRFVALVLFAACTQQPPPIFVVAAVVDLGKLPLPPEGVGRDGGMSGELGGRVLWTFGDAFLSQPAHLDSSGWSTPSAPLDLVHSMVGDQPAQLIPYTAEEIAANQAGALNGFALLPGALVPIDDTTGAAIEGPWDDGLELAPTATGILAPTHDSDYICVEHPELSDASSIVISYSRPTGPVQGDVRLARITLQ